MRPRQVLRDDLRCDDLDWERGKAWAFEQAMGAIWYYADSNIAMSQMGRRTLDASRQTHRQPGPDQTQRGPGLPAPDPPFLMALRLPALRREPCPNRTICAV